MNEKEKILQEKIDKYDQLIRDISFIKIIVFSFTSFIIMFISIIISFILYGVFM